MTFVRLSVLWLGLVCLGLTACTGQQSAPMAEMPVSTLEERVVNFQRYSDELATAGLPSNEGLALLKESGFATIIDLRRPAEGTDAEAAQAQTLGLSYTNIPTGRDLPDAAHLASFRQAVDSAQRPLLIHCRSGGRVGMMWSLYQLENGVELEQSLKEGREIGMSAFFEQAIRERVAMKGDTRQGAE